MKHGTFKSKELNKQIKQINKTIAKKIFASGGTIYLLSSNLDFDNKVNRPQETNKDSQQYAGLEFDAIVNNYIAFNCDTIRGRYVNYFIEL